MNASLHFGPPLPSATAQLVLVHGRGGAPESMLDLAAALPLPQAHGVAPRAPGRTWYPQRFLAPLSANEPYLSQGVAAIEAEVEAALHAGLPPAAIGLIGFSQGACLVLEAFARHPRPYGLVAALSGALPGPLPLVRLSLNLPSVPILLACAREDAHIPWPHVSATADWLRTGGANVIVQEFPGDGHTLYCEEIEWLQQQARGLPAAR